MKITIASFALIYATTSTASANSSSDTCNNLSAAYSITLSASTLKTDSSSMVQSQAFTPPSTKLEVDVVPSV